MTWIPFVCLAAGLIVGLQPLPATFRKAIDVMVNVALVVLMLTIGAKIGVNDTIMQRLGSIGFNCLVISLSAILFSVALTIVIERTVLPLDEVRIKLLSEGRSLQDERNPDQTKTDQTSPLIWIMPLSILAGVLAGYSLIPEQSAFLLGYLLMAALVLLYIGVGLSIGENKHVFLYLKILGWKIAFLPLAILLGSLAGGAISGILLGLPLHVSVISAGGMSYYSLTGAYMTQAYGIEAGTYGFIVNVMREFFTVLLLPLLIKVSKGAPIAGGAAGDMDTMLVPVTRFVGVELGLVTLITGTILTFVVPFLLPLLYYVFS